MNVLMLLAQAATNLTEPLDTVAPVLTSVSDPAEMNMLDMGSKRRLDHDRSCRLVGRVFLYSF